MFDSPHTHTHKKKSRCFWQQYMYFLLWIGILVNNKICIWICQISKLKATRLITLLFFLIFRFSLEIFHMRISLLAFCWPAMDQELSIPYWPAQHSCLWNYKLLVIKYIASCSYYTSDKDSYLWLINGIFYF